MKQIDSLPNDRAGVVFLKSYSDFASNNAGVRQRLFQIDGSGNTASLASRFYPRERYLYVRINPTGSNLSWVFPRDANFGCISYGCMVCLVY